MRIVFAEMSAAIEVPDQGEFLAALAGAAAGWPFRQSEGDERLIATVRAGDGRYEIESGEGEAVETSAVTAACAVIVDLVNAYIEENPQRLCLHCGSVAFAGRLVVFPSEYRAGKSTLVARLAAMGHPVFGDDVLPLSDDDRRGIAMGLVPRLRVPLPACASAPFRRFVAEQPGPGDERYRYLNLRDGRLAERGAQMPLGAIVLLDRREKGSAVLQGASRAAALRALVTRNFSRGERAEHLLDRLHRVTARLPLFTLRYADLDEAAELLETTFAAWPPCADVRGAADPPPPEESRGGRQAAIRLARHVRLRQSPSVRLREVDGELFLADTEGWGIHHLNAVGAGVWRLLAEPTSADEAVEALCGAFPEVGRAAVERDIGALLVALAAEGFVIEAGESSDCTGGAGRP